MSSRGGLAASPGVRDNVNQRPMADSTPAFVVVICFASGLLLIAAGIPLWLGRVPPNALYGVRFASTLSDDGIWYEINARCGRNRQAAT